MNKKLIRLTESDLHKIVKESVNKVLKESAPTEDELRTEQLLASLDRVVSLGDDEKVLVLDIIELLAKSPEAYNKLYQVVNYFQR